MDRHLTASTLSVLAVALIGPCACTSSNDRGVGSGGTAAGRGGARSGGVTGNGAASGGKVGESGPGDATLASGGDAGEADASAGVGGSTRASDGAVGGAASGSGGVAGSAGATVASGGTASGNGGKDGGGMVSDGWFAGSDVPAISEVDARLFADGSAGADAPSSPAACDGGVLALQAVWPIPVSLRPSGIAVDSQGNVYLAGSFEKSADFGTVVLTSSGPQDMFLAKYDPSGALVYANRYGGDSFDLATPTLAVDDAGNAYFGGAFGQTLDFGGATTPLQAITSDSFVAKIGPTGQAIWARRFAWDGETWSNGGNMVYSIAIAPGGDPVVAGVSSGTITLGSTNWTGYGTSTQPFVARLKSTDGSVVWGAASGGTFDTDRPLVAVDSQQRTFIAGRYFSGSGAWGTGVGGVFRVGFDPNGKPTWSRFDPAELPMGVTIDAAGRFVVVEETTSSTALAFGNTNFAPGNSSLVLLFSPIDGTLISGAQVSPTFPEGVASDRRGNSLIVGTYWEDLIWGETTLLRSGEHPLFLAAVDGTSKPAGLAGAGIASTGYPPDSNPYGIAMSSSGDSRIYVSTGLGATATSSIGPIAAGNYIAVFGPDPCVAGRGPQGSATGDPSDHGSLPLDGSLPVTPPDGGTPAPCPASSALAVNGAACPVKMGCGYGRECCICIPTPCGGQPTTWTCTTLATPDPGCPASPPADGTNCSTLRLECTYCASGGRQLATCTAAGWQSGFAQLICN